MIESCTAVMLRQRRPQQSHFAHFAHNLAVEALMAIGFQNPWQQAATTIIAGGVAGKNRIDIRVPAKEPFVLFPRSVSPHYHDKIVSLCVDAGFSPDIRHEVRLWQTVVTTVECGLGVALVPAALINIGDRRVHFKPSTKNRYTSEVRLIRHTGLSELNADPFAAYLSKATQEESSNPLCKL